MKTTLNILLKKNQLTKSHNDFSAEIQEIGSINVEGIISELINEGLNLDRDIALNYITLFNKKASDLLLSGYKIDTGLVNIRPIIKGYLYGGNWNSYINSVSLAYTESYELKHALAETKVNIIDENGELLKISIKTDIAATHIEKKHFYDQSTELRESKMMYTEDSENITIFRKWLFKA